MPSIRRKVSRKIPYKAIALIFGFLFVIYGIFVLLSPTLLAGEKMYSGVSICGINVGGMTRDEVYAVISEKTEAALGDKNIDIVHGDKRRAMDIADKVTVDYSAVADAAYSVGRSGELFDRLSEILGKKVDIPLIVQYDDKYIKSKLTSFAQEIEKENSIFEFSQDMKTAKVDLTGRGIIIDVDATFDKLIENSSNMVFDDITTVIRKEFNKDSVDILYNRLARKPVNATCEIINNKPIIKQHEVGIEVDRSVISENIGKGKTVFEVEITAVLPEVTTEKLEESMFKDVLGEYSTRYNASNIGRSKNMAVASSKINGVVIASGENFSFNRIVGERSYAKGYADANVYVGGRVEQGVGGGICQVVSTLYSAQLYADLQTVVRHNHQFTVSYLPLGQDATVAWDSLDYVFKNNTEYPIKIIATVRDGIHTMRILGTKADKERSIKIITNTISTSTPNERIVSSASLPPGKTVITQNGQNGAIVDTYKVYLRNGVEEDRVFLHRSTYSAMERIITKSSRRVSADDPDMGDSIEILEEEPYETIEPSVTPSDDATHSSEIPDEYTSENGL